MIHRSILAGILIASASMVAVAQDSLISNDRASSAELSRIIAATRAKGLPVEPILAKVNYGLLMKAPAPRIIAAAQSTAARMEEARDALAPQPSELDIAAGELALNSNVSVKSLKDIRRIAANRPVAVPLGVLSQLIASGVEEPRAAKIVAELIRKGASVQQIAELGNEVNSDVQLGTKANSALELRMNRLNAVLGVPGATATTTSDFAATTPSAPGGKKKP